MKKRQKLKERRHDQHPPVIGNRRHKEKDNKKKQSVAENTLLINVCDFGLVFALLCVLCVVGNVWESASFVCASP